MPVTDQTPQVILIDDNAVSLAVSGGVGVPVGTSAILFAGLTPTGTASFLQMDAASRLQITGSVSVLNTVSMSNPSFAPTGSTAPFTGSLVGGRDTSGIFRPLALTTAGFLFVSGTVTLSSSVVRIVGSDGITALDTNEGSTPASSGAIMVQGYDSSTQKGRRISVDSMGRIITNTAGSNFTNATEYGTVATSAITSVPVRATTYNEPNTNARRSISSANAADAAAGTGARQVTLTYYDQTGAGPSTEVITLNGTTFVNTVSTTICYVESIVVTSVGSGGSNVGILTLFNAISAGGGTLATVAAGDNTTLWAHHYVPTGKTAFITGIFGNNDHASNETVLTLRAQTLPTGSNVNFLISDGVLVGGGTGQSDRVFGNALRFAGPARIALYATPDATTNIVTRGSFDIYEQ